MQFNVIEPEVPHYVDSVFQLPKAELSVIGYYFNNPLKSATICLGSATDYPVACKWVLSNAPLGFGCLN
jgi:hypothetical protein